MNYLTLDVDLYMFSLSYVFVDLLRSAQFEIKVVSFEGLPILKVYMCA